MGNRDGKKDFQFKFQNFKTNGSKDSSRIQDTGSQTETELLVNAHTNESYFLFFFNFSSNSVKDINS